MKIISIKVEKADGGYILTAERDGEVVKKGVVECGMDDIAKFKIAPLLGAYILELTPFGGSTENFCINLTDMTCKQ